MNLQLIENGTGLKKMLDQRNLESEEQLATAPLSYACVARQSAYYVPQRRNPTPRKVVKKDPIERVLAPSPDIIESLVSLSIVDKVSRVERNKGDGKRLLAMKNRNWKKKSAYKGYKDVLKNPKEWSMPNTRMESCMKTEDYTNLQLVIYQAPKTKVEYYCDYDIDMSSVSDDGFDRDYNVLDYWGQYDACMCLDPSTLLWNSFSGVLEPRWATAFVLFVTDFTVAVNPEHYVLGVIHLLNNLFPDFIITGCKQLYELGTEFFLRRNDYTATAFTPLDYCIAAMKILSGAVNDTNKMIASVGVSIIIEKAFQTMAAFTAKGLEIALNLSPSEFYADFKEFRLENISNKFKFFAVLLDFIGSFLNSVIRKLEGGLFFDSTTDIQKRMDRLERCQIVPIVTLPDDHILIVDFMHETKELETIIRARLSKSIRANPILILQSRRIDELARKSKLYLHSSQRRREPFGLILESQRPGCGKSLLAVMCTEVICSVYGHKDVGRNRIGDYAIGSKYQDTLFSYQCGVIVDDPCISDVKASTGNDAEFLHRVIGSNPLPYERAVAEEKGAHFCHVDAVVVTTNNLLRERANIQHYITDIEPIRRRYMLVEIEPLPGHGNSDTDGSINMSVLKDGLYSDRGFHGLLFRCYQYDPSQRKQNLECETTDSRVFFSYLSRRAQEKFQRGLNIERVETSSFCVKCSSFVCHCCHEMGAVMHYYPGDGDEAGAVRAERAILRNTVRRAREFRDLFIITMMSIFNMLIFAYVSDFFMLFSTLFLGITMFSISAMESFGSFWGVFPQGLVRHTPLRFKLQMFWTFITSPYSIKRDVIVAYYYRYAYWELSEQRAHIDRIILLAKAFGVSAVAILAIRGLRGPRQVEEEFESKMDVVPEVQKVVFRPVGISDMSEIYVKSTQTMSFDQLKQLVFKNTIIVKAFDKDLKLIGSVMGLKLNDMVLTCAHHMQDCNIFSFERGDECEFPRGVCRVVRKLDEDLMLIQLPTTNGDEWWKGLFPTQEPGNNFQSSLLEFSGAPTNRKVCAYVAPPRAYRYMPQPRSKNCIYINASVEQGVSGSPVMWSVGSSSGKGIAGIVLASTDMDDFPGSTMVSPVTLPVLTAMICELKTEFAEAKVVFTGTIKRELGSRSILKYETVNGIVLGEAVPFRTMSPRTLVENAPFGFYEKFSSRLKHKYSGGRIKTEVVDKVYFSPEHIMLRSNYPSNPDLFPLEIFDCVLSDMFEGIKGEMHPLSLYDTLNGGVFDMNPIDGTTAAGYPYSGQKRDYLLRRGQSGQPPDYTLTNMAMEDFNLFHQNYRSGEDVAYVVKAQVKDEVKKVEKWARVFYASPFFGFILSRMYLAPLMHVIRKYKDRFWCFIGIDATDGPAWTYLYDHWAKFEIRNDGDFSRFDVRHTYLALDGVCKKIVALARNLLYTPEEILVVTNLLYSITHPVVNMQSNYYIANALFTSGFYGTTELNCVLNVAYWKVCFKILCPHLSWESHICGATYGDDVVISNSRQSESEGFTFSACQKIMASLGHELTYASKDQGPSIDPTFLKRRWVRDEGSGLFLAPLDCESIFRMLSHIIPSKDLTMQMCDISRAAMLESFFHGREFYDNMLQDLDFFLYDKLFVQRKTYDDMYVSWRGQQLVSSWNVSPGMTLKATGNFPFCSSLIGTQPILDYSVITSSVQYLGKRSMVRANRKVSYLGPGGDPLYKSLLDINTNLERTKQRITDLTNTTALPSLSGSILPATTASYLDTGIVEQSRPAQEEQTTTIYPTVRITDGAQDVPGLFARPYLLATYVWSNAAFANNLKPMTTLANNPPWFNFLKYYTCFRGTMHIRINTNATPFHYGRIIGAWLPMANTLSSTVVNYRTNVPQFLYSLNHIEIDPNRSPDLEMKIPFFFRNPFLRLTGGTDLTDYGTLYLSAIIGLAQVGQATPSSVDISVFVWFSDVVVDSPTFNAFTATMKRAKDTEATSNGPISKVSTAVSIVASKLTSIPWLAPFATPAKIIADSVTDIAHIFGFSRPAVPPDAHPMTMKYSSALAPTSGRDSVARFGTDSLSALPVGATDIGGVPFDEMSIKYLTSKIGPVGQFSWPTSALAGTALYNIPVNPFLVYTQASGVYYLSPTSTVASCFNYWRGSLIYRFDFVSCPMLRGKVVIGWTPYGAPYGTLPQATTMQRVIVDLSENTTIDVEIKWGSPLAFQPTGAYSGFGTELCTGAGSWIYSYAGAYPANGWLSVNVLNLLASSSASTETVWCNVYMYGGDDLEFARPDTWMSLNYTATMKSSIEPGVCIEPGVLCQPSRVHLGGASNLPNDSLSIFGEKVVSFRSLAKRYSGGYTMTVTQPVTNTGYGNWTIISLSNLLLNTTASHTSGGFNFFRTASMVGILSACFLGQRGNARYKLYNVDAIDGLGTFLSGVTFPNGFTYSYSYPSGALTYGISISQANSMGTAMIDESGYGMHVSADNQSSHEIEALNYHTTYFQPTAATFPVGTIVTGSVVNIVIPQRVSSVAGAEHSTYNILSSASDDFSFIGFMWGAVYVNLL